MSNQPDCETTCDYCLQWIDRIQVDGAGREFHFTTMTDEHGNELVVRCYFGPA